ncbi:Uncharacterised protein [Citrobacter amalonaticus]|nr:Uncharacterised protein [Citrobacter amalonaticus]
MPTPNPLEPVKGAGTTLWIYTGTGNPFAQPAFGYRLEPPGENQGSDSGRNDG